jgi:hypothetical protein
VYVQRRSQQWDGERGCWSPPISFGSHESSTKFWGGIRRKKDDEEETAPSNLQYWLHHRPIESKPHVSLINGAHANHTGYLSRIANEKLYEWWYFFRRATTRGFDSRINPKQCLIGLFVVSNESRHHPYAANSMIVWRSNV